MRPTVVAVGGSGCHLETGSIAFRMLKSRLEDTAFPYEQVHGCSENEETVRVLPPQSNKGNLQE